MAIFIPRPVNPPPGRLHDLPAPMKGTLVLHEYCDYRTWRSSPRSEVFEAFVDEVIASWRASGGEPDIGHDLARWLGELGLDVRGLTAIVEATRPGDPVWAWPRAFVDVGIQRLVDLGRIDPARARAMTESFNQLETLPHAFQTTPMVLEIVARRG